ncbi:FixH family protein [Cytobacillus spongiae]|uniref:FixH family protein n=1 Tax=Cytobacillus spongiae TaxID=2901381 RepID=UPI0032C42487
MMKKTNLFMLSFLLLFVLGACSQEPMDEEPTFLDVKLSLSSEKVMPNEPVTFEALVTYGEEKVNDADEMTFEIWLANSEDHEKIEIEKGEDGVYSLEKSFDVEGTYYVISHVTARGMHMMPKKEFVVGQASAPEEDASSSMDMEESETEEGSDHSNH